MGNMAKMKHYEISRSLQIIVVKFLRRTIKRIDALDKN